MTTLRGALRGILFAAAVGLAGCGSSSNPPPDAPVVVVPDAAVPDAAVPDAAPVIPDAFVADARPHLTTCPLGGANVPEGAVCDGDAGSVCVDGVCESPTAIAVGQAEPFGLTIVAGNAYWANQITSNCIELTTDCGAVKTAPVTATGVSGDVLWTGSGVDYPRYIASNGVTIGFSSTGFNASIDTMLLNGGQQAVLVDIARHVTLTQPAQVAMNDTTIFWADTTLGLWSSVLDGSEAPVMLAGGAPRSVAIDDQYIYWSDVFAGTIQRAALDGSTPITLVTGLGDVVFLVIDGANLYYTDYRHNLVAQVRLDGTQPATIASTESLPLGIAVDTTSVYWATSDGLIRRAPIGGGTALTLASGQSTPWYVVVDDDNVYWTNSGADSVMRLAK